MTDEEKKKLNDKLAEWAGFTKRTRRRMVGRFAGEEHIEAFEDWQAPNRGKWLSTNPFTDSFDACRTWFEPLLGAWEIAYRYYFSGMMYVAKVFAKQGIMREISRTESPSLAFCLAVEKVIDAKKD